GRCSRRRSPSDARSPAARQRLSGLDSPPTAPHAPSPAPDSIGCDAVSTEDGVPRVREAPESSERQQLTLEERLATVPAGPGVYLLKDAPGKGSYVGKAGGPPARVRSYPPRARRGRPGRRPGG